MKKLMVASLSLVSILAACAAPTATPTPQPTSARPVNLVSGFLYQTPFKADLQCATNIVYRADPDIVMAMPTGKLPSGGHVYLDPNVQGMLAGFDVMSKKPAQDYTHQQISFILDDVAQKCSVQ